MAGQDREFDPEAAKKTHGIVLKLIEQAEKRQHIIGEGDLRFAPAFGLTASGQHGKAHMNYAAMHETGWENSDAYRRGLYALLSALETGMKNHGISEFESVRELDELTKDDPND